MACQLVKRQYQAVMSSLFFFGESVTAQVSKLQVCLYTFGCVWQNPVKRNSVSTIGRYPGNPEVMREHNLNCLCKTLRNQEMILLMHYISSSGKQSNRCIWCRRARGKLSWWWQCCNIEKNLVNSGSRCTPVVWNSFGRYNKQVRFSFSSKRPDCCDWSCCYPIAVWVSNACLVPALELGPYH